MQHVPSGDIVSAQEEREIVATLNIHGSMSGSYFLFSYFCFFSLVAQNNILLITSHFAWDRPFSFKAFDFVEIQFPSASNGFLALGNQHYPQTRSALSRSL